MAMAMQTRYFMPPLNSCGGMADTVTAYPAQVGVDQQAADQGAMLGVDVRPLKTAFQKGHLPLFLHRYKVNGRLVHGMLP